MIIALFLSHLVGDFILQWNGLAAWKSTSQKGVLVHCLLVFLTTWFFARLFDPGWWPWVFFIGSSHMVIDGGQLWLRQRFRWPHQGSFALARFALDQILHVGVIVFALSASGYLSPLDPGRDLLLALRQHPWLAYGLGYAFILMPAWVTVKFFVYGLVQDVVPDFRSGSDKYVGIMERVLITTFVVLGQYILVPLVTLPRLLLGGRELAREDGKNLYLAELLASVLLAVAVGLVLRQL